MKPSASRIERMLAKIEAAPVPPSREWLAVIVDDTDDEAVVKEKKEKALAEHVARHPEDVGRKVEDFNWIMQIIVRSWQEPPAARAPAAPRRRSAPIPRTGSQRGWSGRRAVGPTARSSPPTRRRRAMRQSTRQTRTAKADVLSS